MRNTSSDSIESDNDTVERRTYERECIICDTRVSVEHVSVDTISSFINWVLTRERNNFHVMMEWHQLEIESDEIHVIWTLISHKASSSASMEDTLVHSAALDRKRGQKWVSPKWSCLLYQCRPTKSICPAAWLSCPRFSDTIDSLLDIMIPLSIMSDEMRLLILMCPFPMSCSEKCPFPALLTFAVLSNA